MTKLNFLIPFTEDFTDYQKKFEDRQWGKSLICYDNESAIDHLGNLAIVGLPFKQLNGTIQSSTVANEVRENLYSLYNHQSGIQLVDFGNLDWVEDAKENYYRLATILMKLLEKNYTVIFIGGTHELTYAQYLGYQEQYRSVNLVCIDERIDLKHAEKSKMTRHSYLMHIFMHQPNYLFNYTHIGYQTFYCDPKEIETLNSLDFDTIRLGEVKNKINETEPILRTADLLSIDFSCVEMNSSFSNKKSTPNGFSGEEFCKIMNYAGYADKLSSLALYEIDASGDTTLNCELAAQAIWYFMDGFSKRVDEKPSLDNKNFINYMVDFEGTDYHISFWKSIKTNRWWMEIPDEMHGDNTHNLIPCSYEDYQMACREELPDRYMKAFNKMN